MCDEGRCQLQLRSRKAHSWQLQKFRDMAHGSQGSFLLRAAADAVVMMPEALWVCLYSNPSQVFVCRHYVPLGKNCILFSAECSWSNGLVDHQELEGIVFFSAGNDLRLLQSVNVIMLGMHAAAALLTYRMRLTSDGILAYCVLYCLLATTRQMYSKPSCACVAWMLIVVVLRGVCSWTDASSCSGVGMTEQ